MVNQFQIFPTKWSHAAWACRAVRTEYLLISLLYDTDPTCRCLSGFPHCQMRKSEGRSRRTSSQLRRKSTPRIDGVKTRCLRRWQAPQSKRAHCSFREDRHTRWQVKPEIPLTLSLIDLYILMMSCIRLYYRDRWAAKYYQLSSYSLYSARGGNLAVITVQLRSPVMPVVSTCSLS